ncbi:hypothetical protein L4C33_18020 [Vibrio makurazakiensis]|uniref:hypothetical protein n=1 Tax=Vibrio makurazakiensis TaxID=2910250 RepID=UPI003D14FC86
MHPSIYMLEKELLEHKMTTRLPAFVALCGLLLFVSIFTSSNLQDNLFFQMEFRGDVSETHMEFVQDLNMLVTFGAGLISLILTSLYLPKTLRKERQEGSSMFWRSMPVSSLLTHAVKLAYGLLIIPMICSLLVLSADFLLWIINLGSEGQLALLVEQESLFYVATNWLVFLSRMVLVAFTLLPLACLALMVSQLVSSPILVIAVVGFAAKWLASVLFGFYGVGYFMSEILALPVNVLFSDQPINALFASNLLYLAIYFALGIVAFGVSLALYKTDDVSWKSLIKR